VDVETIRYYEKQGLMPAPVIHPPLPGSGHAAGRCEPATWIR
jgi:hypothetical protein